MDAKNTLSIDIILNRHKVIDQYSQQLYDELKFVPYCTRLRLLDRLEMIGGGGSVLGAGLVHAKTGGNRKLKAAALATGGALATVTIGTKYRMELGAACINAIDKKPFNKLVELYSNEDIIIHAISKYDMNIPNDARTIIASLLLTQIEKNDNSPQHELNIKDRFRQKNPQWCFFQNTGRIIRWYKHQDVEYLRSHGTVVYIINDNKAIKHNVNESIAINVHCDIILHFAKNSMNHMLHLKKQYTIRPIKYFVGSAEVVKVLDNDV